MSEALIETLKKDEGLLKRATQIKTHKGGKEKNYTIGYGYNLSAHQDPKSDLIEAGVDEELVDDVLNGRAEIDEVQATNLLNIAVVRAKKDAIRIIPNFDKLPPSVQDVVVNMTYQLGPTRLRGFKQFREALYLGDFDKAAEEVLNSKMAVDDSPDRSARHAKVLREAAKLVKQQQLNAPSQQERIDRIKRDILYQRALKVRQNNPDTRVSKLAELFMRMQRSDNDGTVESTPNQQPETSHASP